MKFLKTITVLAMLTICISAMAQQTEKAGKTPEEKAKRQLNAINKECNLSNEQSVKVEKILIETQNRLVTLKATKPVQKGEKIIDLKAINDHQNAEMRKVLSADQYEKYLALTERQKEKMRIRKMEKQNGSIDNKVK